MLNIIKKINKILDEVVPRGGAYDGKRCDLLKFGNSKKTTNERLNKLSRSFAVFLMFFLIFSTTAQAAFVEPTVGPASSDQDFLQNILGANNANNDFDSSSVVSNADGSLIERLQYIVEAITSLWTKSGNDLYYITGNVGIGTTTPQYGQLEVKPTAGNSATGITLNDGTNATARSWIGSGDLWHMTRGSVATNGITMDTSGNIGIGTTSVSTYKLNVHGSLYADDIYTSGSTFYMGGNPLFTKSNSTLDFGVETDESINFTINDSSVMKVDTSGNVGIGTTTPATKLDIYSTTSGILLPRMTTTQRDAISSPTESEIVYNTTDDELQYYSSSSSWSTLGGGSTTIDVTQSSHGLSVGNVVRSSGTDGQYTKAQADSTSNVEVIGIVTEVADANNFTITVSGPVTVADAVPNLTAGTALFLATTTAGALTSVEPTGTGEVSKPIAIVTTANSEMIFFNMRGVEVTTTDSYIATLIEDTTPQLGGALDVNGQQITSVSNGNIVLMPNGTGNVGIGTAGPGYKLDVNGDARIGGDFTVTGTSYLGNIQISADNITSKQITAADGDGLKLYEDGGAGIFVQDGGNVGIGTTAPGYLLDVDGVAVANTLGTVGEGSVFSDTAKSIQIYHSAGTALFKAQGADASTAAKIQFRTEESDGGGSINIMTMDNLGNVGIGTAAPLAKLDVKDGDIVLTGTNVAHGITGWVATDVYGQIKESTVDAGGLGIRGFIDSADNSPLLLGGLSAVTNTNPYVLIQAIKKSGTGFGDIDSTEIAVAINNNNTRLVTVLGSGNVGIGTTAPGAKLDVYSATDSADIFHIRNGGATGNSAFATFGDLTAGTGQLGIQFGRSAATVGSLIIQGIDEGVGANALSLNPSGGNVGIGTTAPSAPLEVKGDIVQNNQGSTASFSQYYDKSTYPNLYNLIRQQGAGGMLIKAYGNSSSWDSITFSNDGGDRMIISPSGNVGIGTSSITNYGLNYKNLDVSGSNGAYITLIGTTNTVKVDIAAETAAGYVGTKTAHPFIFRTNDVARMRIDSSGNVGIGTTSPGAPLEVYQSSATYNTIRLSNLVSGGYRRGGITFQHGVDAEEAVQAIQMWSNNASTDNTLNFGGGAGDTNAVSQMIFYTAANGSILTGTERMRIDGSGNVGIGTASPNNAKLVISSTDSNKISIDGGSIQNGMRWEAVGGANGFYLFNGTYGTAGFGLYNINTNSSPLWIQNGGNVGIGTTGPNSKLDVNGDFRFSDVTGGSAQVNKIYIGSSGNAGDRIDFVNSAAEETIPLSLNDSGNIGIGTTNPGTFLEVAGTSAKTLTGKFHTSITDLTTMGTGVGGGITFTGYKTAQSAQEMFAGIDGYKENATVGNAAGALRFLTQQNGAGLVEWMRITSTGNVGIGTTAPDYKFQVDSGAAYMGGGFEFIPAYTTRLHITKQPGYETYIEKNASTGVMTIQNGHGSLIYFNQGISVASIIDRTPYPKDLSTAYEAILSMQRLPDGIYDENDKEQQLDHDKLSDFVKGQGGYRDLSSTVSSQNEVLKYMLGNLGGINSSLYVNSSTGNVGIGTTAPGYKLTLNGQPAANGYTAWTNYSDRRLKDNVIDLITDDKTNILDKISKLRPVTFNYNELTGYDEETRSRRISGFIAQELQEIFPQMVATTTINGTEYLDTNLSDLSLYLVEGMKEQQEQIKELKVENDELKQEKDIQITNLKKEKDIQVGNLLKMIKKLQTEIELLKE